MKLFYLLIVFACLMLTSCTDEDNLFLIEPELQPYFDSFAEEAAIRGIIVDFEAAEVETAFTDLEGTIPGQCSHSEASPNLLRIDPEYWENYSEWEKEFLIFQSIILGLHCACLIKRVKKK